MGGERSKVEPGETIGPKYKPVKILLII